MSNKLKLPSKTFQLQRESLIVAIVIVSESEIQRVIPNYNANTECWPPVEDVLFNLGMDTSLNYIRQDGLWHRNRLNEVVLCSRWVGQERQDIHWIESGYASKEAKDKYSGNRILEDLYRSKMLTRDAQETLEDRDRHTIIDESVWN